MTERNGGQVFDKTGRIHVVQGLATSVSTDGTTALMRFKTSVDGSDLEITFPAAAIKSIGNMVQDLIAAANKRNIGMAVQLRRPTTVSAGHHDMDRGAVYLLFDQDMPSEVVMVLRDDDAMKFANAIRSDVLDRMTPQERAKILVGLADDVRSKLIIPR